jgi:hypothetical protein
LVNQVPFVAAHVEGWAAAAVEYCLLGERDATGFVPRGIGSVVDQVVDSFEGGLAEAHDRIIHADAEHWESENLALVEDPDQAVFGRHVGDLAGEVGVAWSASAG